MGFGAVVLAVVASALFIGYQLNNMQDSQDEVLNVRYPVMLAGNRLIEGVEKSVAALRGYMILGGELEAAQKFKAQRKQAWLQVDEAVAFLNKAKASLNDDELSNMEQFKSLLPKIRSTQQAIEDIAQTPENQPALELLVNDAGPKAELMLEYITGIIELEGENEEEEGRKEVFKMFADTRGSFATAVGSLRAYLITGESRFKDQFDEKWLINTDAYLAIDEEIDMLNEDQQELWTKYEALREQFAPVSIEMFRLRDSEDWNIANHKLENEVEPLIQQLSSLLEQMAKQQNSKVDEEVSVLGKIITQVDLVLILATLFSIVIAASVAIPISRNLAASMGALVLDANDISKGDLSTDHSNEKLRSTQDEIGQLARSFWDMNHSLSDMVATVKRQGGQMRIAAFQVASLSEEILNTSAQEESNSGEVGDATEKLLNVSQRSLAVATETQEVVQAAQNHADVGINAVNATIAEMDRSVSEVKQTVVDIESLHEASQRIFAITDTIHQIAEQTNLLALNAAIEAARAGEHGRGFAVVADEVRNLAIKTSMATQEITELIAVLKGKVEASIESMSRAANHVYDSQSKAAETADAIDAIGKSVMGISQCSEDIRSGADDQMQQLALLKGKLEQLFDTLREDSSRAGAVSIIARVLYGVTENINISLDRFTTWPAAPECIGAKPIEGCLRAEIYQEQGAYEGATRNFKGDELGIDVSTALCDDSDVVLTIFLPHKNFDDYKAQVPITIEGHIVNSTFSDSVYHYKVRIDKSEQENLELLTKAFEFFS